MDVKHQKLVVILLIMLDALRIHLELNVFMLNQNVWIKHVQVLHKNIIKVVNHFYQIVLVIMDKNVLKMKLVQLLILYQHVLKVNKEIFVIGILVQINVKQEHVY